MDQLLLGDNQFFGINHLSEAKAREQSIRFQDISKVIAIIDSALDEGVNTFMCTTHERIETVCSHVKSNPTRYANFAFYPCMPYAHKYANAVTEDGMIGALRRMLPQTGVLDALVRSTASIATKDIEGIGHLLIDAEMKMFHGLNTPVVFLQNVFVDFVLGMNMPAVFSMFAKHVRKRYGAEPGFITMNLPRLLGALEEAEIENPIVCSNINKIGFRMCGGVEAYQQALLGQTFRPIAMSVFASGALAPREALSWVLAQPNIQSIVFGASTHTHVVETCALARELWQDRPV
jgi:hypothetical protein